MVAGIIVALVVGLLLGFTGGILCGFLFGNDAGRKETEAEIQFAAQIQSLRSVR
jgi:hypothetical protein